MTYQFGTMTPMEAVWCVAFLACFAIGFVGAGVWCIVESRNLRKRCRTR